ncbi:hypothetical protein [Mycobacterium sp. E2479]|uniref:hypothetical protein n=1 Tax=Mycobacterium sp. E2479 TaxID=1834134 RepID=UPI0008019FF7|nr:hypothetical protein [Mycobacterium sp. E2479]OBH53805.1 hypothetical protein A5686_00590 [Mycobacterium sp. E2479]
MHFEAKKVIVVDGSASSGRQAAVNVANSVTYLPSDEINWLTGAILIIDGGIIAGRNTSANTPSGDIQCL